MGILFSQVENKDLSYQIESPEVDFIEEGFESSYEGMSDEYTSIMMEFLQANLIAMKSPNPLSIAMESLGDTSKAIKAWFVKWLSRFRKFVRETLERLSKFYSKGEILVNKYMKELPAFEPFYVNMYKFSVAPTDLEVSEVHGFISTVREGYIRIMRAGKEELSSVVAVEMSKIKGNAALDDIRGKMTKQPAISIDNYRQTLFSMFRNNMPVPQKTEIDRNRLVIFCREYMALKVMLPAIKKNKDTMEKMTQEMISFIEKQPNAIREYHKEHSVYNMKYLSKNPSVISGRRMDFEDLLKRKTTALTMYFAAANTSLKGIQMIYDTYFTEKMMAVRDAMMAYTKCIEKAYASKRMDGETK